MIAIMVARVKLKINFKEKKKKREERKMEERKKEERGCFSYHHDKSIL